MSAPPRPTITDEERAVLDDALRAAIEAKDMDAVADAVTKGATVNAADANGRQTVPMPLMTAIALGNVPAARYLIETAGFDFNYISPFGSGYLHAVCSAPQPAGLEIARLLIAAGANVNNHQRASVAPEAAAFPIQTAVHVDSYDFVALFVASGADLTVTESSSFGPLVSANPVETAVVLKRSRALKAFVDAGVSMDDSLQQWARSSRMQPEGLAVLLDAGYDPSALSEVAASYAAKRSTVLAENGVEAERPSAE